MDVTGTLIFYILHFLPNFSFLPTIVNCNFQYGISCNFILSQNLEVTLHKIAYQYYYGIPEYKSCNLYTEGLKLQKSTIFIGNETNIVIWNNELNCELFETPIITDILCFIGNSTNSSNSIVSNVTFEQTIGKKILIHNTENNLPRYTVCNLTYFCRNEINNKSDHLYIVRKCDEDNTCAKNCKSNVHNFTFCASNDIETATKHCNTTMDTNKLSIQYFNIKIYEETPCLKRHFNKNSHDFRQFESINQTKKPIFNKKTTNNNFNTGYTVQKLQQTTAIISLLCCVGLVLYAIYLNIIKQVKKNKITISKAPKKYPKMEVQNSKSPAENYTDISLDIATRNSAYGHGNGIYGNELTESEEYSNGIEHIEETATYISLENAIAQYFNSLLANSSMSPKEQLEK